MPEEISRAACDHSTPPSPRPPEPRGPSSWGAGPINSSDVGERDRRGVWSAGRDVSAAKVNRIASEVLDRMASESHDRGLLRLNLALVPAASCGSGTSRTREAAASFPTGPWATSSVPSPEKRIASCRRGIGCHRYRNHAAGFKRKAPGDEWLRLRLLRRLRAGRYPLPASATRAGAAAEKLPIRPALGRHPPVTPEARLENFRPPE